MARRPSTSTTHRRDPNAALGRRVVYGTPRHAGTYAEIIHGHPDALRGYMQLRMAFRGAKVHVEPMSDETAGETVFRTRLLRIVDGLLFDGGPGGFDAAIEYLADAVTYGAAVFETVWHDQRLELYPVPLHTITKWDVDEYGGLSATQQVEGYSAVTIPSNRLIRVVPVSTAGPEGIGVLRPLVYLFELWKQTLHDLGIRAQKEAGGIILYQPEDVADDEVRTVSEASRAFADGQLSAFSLPPGWEATQVELPRAEDKLPLVEYFDTAIRNQFSATLENLVQSGMGSRALGETLAAESADENLTLLEYVVHLFGQQLTHEVAKKYGFEGRLPRITTDPLQDESKADLVDVYNEAADLTDWTDEDRDALREDLGLHPIEPHEHDPVDPSRARS